MTDYGAVTCPGCCISLGTFLRAGPDAAHLEIHCTCGDVVAVGLHPAPHVRWWRPNGAITVTVRRMPDDA